MHTTQWDASVRFLNQLGWGRDGYISGTKWCKWLMADWITQPGAVYAYMLNTLMLVILHEQALD